MPYARPTQTALRTQAAQDIGAGGLLRKSPLGIIGRVVADMAWAIYGFIDYVAKQTNPFTATDEYAAAWAALKQVYIKAPTQATGVVDFPGTTGKVLVSGTAFVRADGQRYTTTADGTVGAGGTVTVPAIADADPAGLVGAIGNCDIGIGMTLEAAVEGIQSGGTVSIAFTGGADLETQDAFKSRYLLAYQEPVQGGAQTDYVQWALAVPGVTRAWSVPNAMGPGTVSVFTMFDTAEAAHGGFPQGTDGGATDETRTTAATGDQLTVANALYPLRPATALVYSVAPTAAPQAFTIKGIASAYQPAVSAAIVDVFLREGTGEGGTVDIAHIWSAIAAVSGVNDFVIQSPVADITTTVGQLPTVGTITWA